MEELTDTDNSPVNPSGPSTTLDNFAGVCSTNGSDFAQVIFNNVPNGEGNGSVRDTQTLGVASNNEGSLVASEQTSQVSSEQTAQGEQATTDGEGNGSVRDTQTLGVASNNEGSLVASEQTSQVASEQTAQGKQATTAIQVTIDSLSEELEERKKESDRFQQMYQEEKEKSSDLRRVVQLKSQSLEEEKEKSAKLEAELQEEREKSSDLVRKSQAREIETDEIHNNFHECSMYTADSRTPSKRQSSKLSKIIDHRIARPEQKMAHCVSVTPKDRIYAFSMISCATETQSRIGCYPMSSTVFSLIISSLLLVHNLHLQTSSPSSTSSSPVIIVITEQRHHHWHGSSVVLGANIPYTCTKNNPIASLT